MINPSHAVVSSHVAGRVIAGGTRRIESEGRGKEGWGWGLGGTRRSQQEQTRRCQEVPGADNASQQELWEIGGSR